MTNQQGVTHLDDDAAAVAIKSSRLTPRFLRDEHGRKSRHNSQTVAKLCDSHKAAQAKRRAAKIAKRAATLLAHANNNPGKCRDLLEKASKLARKCGDAIVLVQVPNAVSFHRHLASNGQYAQAA